MLLVNSWGGAHHSPPPIPMALLHTPENI